MRSTIKELNGNLHCPIVSRGNIGQLESLDRALNNLVTSPPNLVEGNLAVTKNTYIDLGPA